MRFFVLFLSFLSAPLFAQNIEKLGNWSPGEFCNDIWGYDAPDGRFYAIMGAFSGTYVLDVTDPSNIVKSGYVSGSGSTWRDIKTYRHYAYVTNETFGLDIIDLSGLPGSVRHVQMMNIQNFHNLYIDTTTATMYLADASSSGSVHIYSLQDPENPVKLNEFGTESHDVYVRDGVAYVAQGRKASIGIYDVSDPMNPVGLQTIHIPNGGYAHNSWLNASGDYLITTEETGGKTIKLWDIRDLNNIEKVSEVLGASQLAHNAHIEGNFAYISHYESGVIVADVSNPEKMALVGGYDTYPESNDPSYNGDWGVYPHSRSGNIYLSDEDRGLFVLKFNGTHASFYKGVVRNALTLDPIEGAFYALNNGSVNGTTNSMGVYDFGVGLSDTTTMRVNAFGYQQGAILLTPTGGATDSMDILLQPAPQTALQVRVVNQKDEAIAGAHVELTVESIWLEEPQTYSGETNNDGLVTFENLPVSDGDAVNYTRLITTADLPYAESETDTLILTDTDINKWTVTMNPADVLIINGDPNGQYGSYITDALNETGYTVYEYKTEEQNAIPGKTDVERFNMNYVIWMTGDASTNVLTEAAQDSITAYLKNGISVLLSGQNIAESLNGNGSAFLSEWLGVSYQGNIGTKIIKGNPEHTLGQKISRIGLYDSQGANNQVSQDLITADSSQGVYATLYYGNSDYETAAVTRTFDDYGSSLFFAAFGIEAVYKSSASFVGAGELIDDVFAWFDDPTGFTFNGDNPAGSFRLYFNYPNPFNPSTVIAFDLPRMSSVRLTVYDITGREMTRLVDNTMPAGSHKITVHAENWSSGIYFYRLEAGGFSQTRRMLLIK